MAEEVQGTVHGGNGERLELKIGSQAFGLSAKDLLPILLILLMGGCGYLFYTNLIALARLLDRKQDTLQAAMHDNREAVLTTMHEWREAIEDQTQYIRKMLQVLEYNTGRPPGDRIPLDTIPPPTAPPLGAQPR